MAGSPVSHNQTYMSPMSFLREATGGETAPAALPLLLEGLKPENLVPNVRLDPAPPCVVRHSDVITLAGFNERGGVEYPIGGLFRAVATANVNLSLYALFVPDSLTLASDPIRITPFLLAESTGPLLEYRNPPGDCVLTVLASGACRIYYSQSR